MSHSFSYTKLKSNKVYFRIEDLLKIEPDFLTEKEIKLIKKEEMLSSDLEKKIISLCSTHNRMINLVLYREDRLFTKVPFKSTVTNEECIGIMAS